MTSGCSMICRPWKPNSSTSVASSASSDTGASRCSTCCSLGGPPRASSQRRSNVATATGSRMYRETESASVAHGTVIDDRPSNTATRGAKASTMIASLSATWLRVKLASPRHRLLQTNTIAVHGAAASRISPAM